MSLIVLKKKTQYRYYNNHSTENGFSLNNSRRNDHHYNNVRTLFRGTSPRGYGSCCSIFPTNIINSQYRNSDPIGKGSKSVYSNHSLLNIKKNIHKIHNCKNKNISFKIGSSSFTIIFPYISSITQFVEYFNNTSSSIQCEFDFNTKKITFTYNSPFSIINEKNYPTTLYNIDTDMQSSIQDVDSEIIMPIFNNVNIPKQLSFSYDNDSDKFTITFPIICYNISKFVHRFNNLNKNDDIDCYEKNSKIYFTSEKPFTIINEPNYLSTFFNTLYPINSNLINKKYTIVIDYNFNCMISNTRLNTIRNT